MAKKEVGKPRNRYLEMILKETNKELGEGVLKNGTDLLNKKQIVIPISPMLDVVCGGVPTGGFTVLYGPPKVGKTITALQIAANAQDIKYKTEGEDEGRFIYYHNIEHRIQPRDVQGIANLDLERFMWIESRKGKILTAEEHLAQAEKEITTHPGCIVIIDSVAALLTSAEATKGMDEMQMAAGAKLLAKFCRKIAGAVAVNDCMIICITQLMGNPAGGPGKGGGNKEKGGFALGYQVDTKLYGSWKEDWTASSDSDENIGQIVHWKVINSPIKSPGRQTKSYIRYGTGIDKTWELMQLGKNLGIIEQSGTWYKWGGQSYHGEAKMCDVFYSSKDELQKLEEEVRKFYS